MIDVVWQTMMGTGLAASAGLRAFLPLLVVGTAARFDVVALGEKFTWMSSDAALIVFSVAVVLEVLGEDHVIARAVDGPADEARTLRL